MDITDEDTVLHVKIKTLKSMNVSNNKSAPPAPPLRVLFNPHHTIVRGFCPSNFNGVHGDGEAAGETVQSPPIEDVSPHLNCVTFRNKKINHE